MSNPVPGTPPEAERAPSATGSRPMAPPPPMAVSLLPGRTAPPPVPVSSPTAPPPIPVMAPPPMPAWAAGPAIPSRPLLPPVDPAVRRRQRRRLTLRITAGALLALLLGVGWASWWRHNSPQARREAKAAEAFSRQIDAVDGAASATPDQRKAMTRIAVLIENVRDAAVRKDRSLLQRTFDASGFLDRVAEGGMISFGTTSLREQYLKGINSSLMKVGPLASRGGWVSHRIVRIRFNPSTTMSGGYDASVFLRAQTAGGAAATELRFWVRCNGYEEPRWYDFEFIDGTRETTVVGGEWAAAERSAPWAGLLPSYDGVTRAATSGNAANLQAAVEAAESARADFPSGPPAPIEATMKAFSALSSMRRKDFARASTLLDEAIRLQPDFPFAFWLRGRVRDNQGRFAEALADATHYREEYATDALIEDLIGDCQFGLGRPELAAVAFGRVLDEDRDNADALKGLAIVLPAEKRAAALTERFARAHKPRDLFYKLAEPIGRLRHRSILPDFVAAFQSVQPDDPWGAYYQASVLQSDKKHAEAADLLEPHLKAIPDEQPAKREQFLDLYFQARADAGQVLRGYEAAPDRAEAFKWFAGRLWGKPHAAELHALVAAHCASVPGEPLLDLYDGKAFEAAGDYPAADEAYSRGLAAAVASGGSVSTQVAPVSERYRWARVEERLAAGRWRFAWQDETPERRDATFNQLARRAHATRRFDDLGELIAMQAGIGPNQPSVFYWSSQLMLGRRQYKAAVRLLDDHRAELLADADRRFDFADAIVRAKAFSGDAAGARVEAMDAARRLADLQKQSIAQMPDDAPQGTRAAVAKEPEPSMWHLLMIHAATGDAANATKDASVLIDDGDEEFADLYSDPDIGPALRSPGFASFRAKYPPPKPGEADSGEQ